MQQSWAAIVGAELIIGLALWCVILWDKMRLVGVLPFIAGIVLAMSGLFALSAAAAWTGLEEAVKSGGVPAGMAGLLLPRRAISAFLHDAPLTLGLLIAAAGPIAALLLRRRVYNWRSIGLVLLATVVGIMAYLPVAPSQTLVTALAFRSALVLGVGGTFFFGVWLAVWVTGKPHGPLSTPTP